MHEPHRPKCAEEGLPDIPPMTEEHLARIGKALGNVARVRILEQFDECRPRSASEVVRGCQLAQSTVSEHLRVLREAGILFDTHDGPYVWYCVRRSLLRAYARAIQELADGPVFIAHRG